MLDTAIFERFLATPGKRFRLSRYDTEWQGPKEFRSFDEDERKERAQQYVQESLKQLAQEQERLWAQDRYSVLVVLQAMDAAGKDGLIKHVMSGLNPQGCSVSSFKRPSEEELDHDFLWRCCSRLPRRGEIGIFNRSYYEEVLVVRVHPEFLKYQRLPEAKPGRKLWERRYESINDFEKHLARNGYAILKFFLHVSKEEQKQRFLERLDNPEKNWKFSEGDVKERQYWDEYMRAFEDAIGATSTKLAPWYVIPADNKWMARALVSGILAKAIADLPLELPKLSPERREAFAEARRQLEHETSD